MKEENPKPYNFYQKSFKAHLEENLEDPVSLEIMQNPYLLKEIGHTCDKSTWDIPQLSINPYTGINFNPKDLVENRKVKAICKLFNKSEKKSIADEDLCLDIIKILEDSIHVGLKDFTINSIFELVYKYGQFLKEKNANLQKIELKKLCTTEENNLSQTKVKHLVKIINNLSRKFFLIELMYKLYPYLDEANRCSNRQRYRTAWPNKHESTIESLYKWMMTKYSADNQTADDHEYNLIDQDTFDTLYGLLENINSDMNKRFSEDKKSGYDLLKSICLFPLKAFGFFQPVKPSEKTHLKSLMNQSNLSRIDIKLVIKFSSDELECIYNDPSCIEPIITSKKEEIKEARDEKKMKIKTNFSTSYYDI